MKWVMLKIRRLLLQLVIVLSHLHPLNVQVDQVFANEWSSWSGDYLHAVAQMALATDQSVFLFGSIIVTLTSVMLKRHIILSS